MRRYAVATLLALAAFLPATAALPQSESEGETIVFAVGEWPPFVSEIENDYGIHPRLVSKVFEAAGYEVEFDFMPWQRAAAATKAGQYVATFPWQNTEARAGDFLISSQPLGPNRSVAYYEASRFPEGLQGETLKEMADAGYSFVGVRSYVHTFLLTDYGADLHIVSDSELAWQMLARGRIDIYIDNEHVGDTERVDFLGPARASDFAKSAPISDDPLYILFSRNHPKAQELLEVWDSTATH